MDKLEEMDRFLEKFNLPRPNKEGTETMDKPITSTEIEAVIKHPAKNKSLGPDGFTGAFYQTFRGANSYPSKTRQSRFNAGYWKLEAGTLG